jgi:hypothetical protein
MTNPSSGPRTKETELRVQEIINLQNVANNLSDDSLIIKV